ncbi:hypothetical protein BDV93DRAFT_579579 [Ceratobasidium sp. AG-I]|nr:hypothetical protein BDV93DRAFT_579579 [Ceratobasidium sp. AG-I]
MRFLSIAVFASLIATSHIAAYRLSGSLPNATLVKDVPVKGIARIVTLARSALVVLKPCVKLVLLVLPLERRHRVATAGQASISMAARLQVLFVTPVPLALAAAPGLPVVLRARLTPTHTLGEPALHAQPVLHLHLWCLPEQWVVQHVQRRNVLPCWRHFLHSLPGSASSCTTCPLGTSSAAGSSSCGPLPSKRAQPILSAAPVCNGVGYQHCDVLSETGRSECINIMTTLGSCGGCVGPKGEGDKHTGRDCSAIPYVDRVKCQAGRCNITSCRSGYELSGGFCAPSTSSANNDIGR